MARTNRDDAVGLDGGARPAEADAEGVARDDGHAYDRVAGRRRALDDVLAEGVGEAHGGPVGEGLLLARAQFDDAVDVLDGEVGVGLRVHEAGRIGQRARARHDDEAATRARQLEDLFVGREPRAEVGDERAVDADLQEQEGRLVAGDLWTGLEGGEGAGRVDRLAEVRNVGSEGPGVRRRAVPTLRLVADAEGGLALDLDGAAAIGPVDGGPEWGPPHDHRLDRATAGVDGGGGEDHGSAPEGDGDGAVGLAPHGRRRVVELVDDRQLIGHVLRDDLQRR